MRSKIGLGFDSRQLHRSMQNRRSDHATPVLRFELHTRHITMAMYLQFRDDDAYYEKQKAYEDALASSHSDNT